MYILKAFYTNGASRAEHTEFVAAWNCLNKVVYTGVREGTLLRVELWDTIGLGSSILNFMRAKTCPLAVFDFALVEEVVPCAITV